MANNIPGKDISKTTEASNKLQSVKEKIDKVNSFVSVPAAFLGGSDGLSSVRSIIENFVDGPLFDITQELKQQAKAKAIQKIREELPTEQELKEKILEKSCDIQVINIVRNTKETTESILNKGKNTLDGVIKRLTRLQEKTEKSLNSLVEISILLGIFQALLSALQALVLASKFALLFLTGIFASAAAAKPINDAINKGEELILKYVGAIKLYTGYALKAVVVIISIFNLIPLVIDVFKFLLQLVEDFIELLNNFYRQYIIKCIPGGENADREDIDKFINFNTPNLTDLKPDVLGDYIHDDSTLEHRIYRPKIN